MMLQMTVENVPDAPVEDAPKRCYQIQKMLQIRLNMFNVEDDVSDDGSMLKMI
ncbi:hypothetical protein HanXRQr2_Chr02g0070081 [Helianthus annuus]|uniref:Uncharacterized protein n=2 Tax=Helianthus annuus TaxID=4232 RepID=A0A9K3JPE5_HELAN|nr:hypothetical protein HanXRQr2_Chr02g0070081 [Helianthus annuus]KAJ0952090.1 hypothetical protein HanPSC8_Chr02g0068091 [Helianthus annuus]